jgi:hypothetical protein
LSTGIATFGAGVSRAATGNPAQTPSERCNGHERKQSGGNAEPDPAVGLGRSRILGHESQHAARPEMTRTRTK